MSKQALIDELSNDPDGLGYSSKTIYEIQELLTKPRNRPEKVIKDDALSVILDSPEDYTALSTAERDYLNLLLANDHVDRTALNSLFSQPKISAKTKRNLTDLPSPDLSPSMARRIAHKWEVLYEALLDLGWIEPTGNRKGR